jgi:hypothetical protein
MQVERSFVEDDHVIEALPPNRALGGHRKSGHRGSRQRVFRTFGGKILHILHKTGLIKTEWDSTSLR